jgi:FtsP/CotA-like multicopper oxidase with cupredoxin domain
MSSRREFLAYAAASAACSLVSYATPRQPQVTVRITSVTHEVAPGQTWRTKAYNGAVPAPVITLTEGETTEIRIINETDTPEYVHWHGLRVSAQLDGTQEENSLVVPARGEIRYLLTARDPGSRFIHSHTMSGMGLDCGPYSGQFGFVDVRSRAPRHDYDLEFFIATHEWGPKRVWTPDDNDDNQRAPTNTGTWEVAYEIGSINGKALGHGEPLRVKQGQRVLLRMLNASATESIKLALPGHKFQVIALDGNPVPFPQTVETIALGTAERVDALVLMDNPGVWILGSADDIERERGGMGVVVEYAGKSNRPTWTPPSSLAWDYVMFGAGAPASADVVPLPMTIERNRPAGSAMEQWLINGTPYSPDAVTLLRKDTTYRLLLRNRSDDDHPIHLHRHPFELISINGRPTSGIMKDVVVLKAYQRMELDFRPDQTGLCLFHCHQQMHMDNGFKLLFKVV